MHYSLVELIVQEHIRHRFLFCLRLKCWGQAAMLHGALPPSLAPRGSCTQIMKHLSRAPRVPCRGGLNQARPAPRVPAVPRRTREPPPSSFPLGAAWNTRSPAGALARRSQEECVRAPACLPTRFCKSGALPARSPRGDETSAERCRPAWCSIQYLLARTGERRRGEPLPRSPWGCWGSKGREDSLLLRDASG